jgi:hypothetical protein
MAASPEDQARTMIANLRKKTGHSLEEWLAILRGREGDAHGRIVKTLKGEHGVTHGFANLIAHSLRAGVAADGAATPVVDPVIAQYEGKASSRPIYDAIITFVSSLGDDVEIAPKKSYVSLRRGRQFGLVQASTKSRVDLGLRLDGVEPEARLEASGSFNSMVSHRIRLSALDAFDEQVREWLEAAYRDA